jgi:glucan 1,3-beta-glucosidase
MSYREEKHFESSKEIFANLGVDFTPHEGVDFNDYSTEKDLKKLWNDTLKTGMHGLCFSMYEDEQKPGDVITIKQVERRIEIIKPYTKWVRSFSCVEGNEHIPRMAHKHGLKNMVGAWLSDDLEMNELEIAGLIELAKEGCVDIAAVGNEVLYRNDLTIEQLLGYIKRVKEALPGIPVGYVDASLNHMQQMYGQAVNAANGKKVIITESGWPSKGESLRGAHSSEDNAMKYFINAQAWSAKDDIDIFYFSSFDESWKVGAEGVVGAYWGLWDKHEKLKY